MSDMPSSLSEKTSLFTKWFAGAGLLLMTAIIAWQVFARYVLNASPAWGEQAALLLMIWYVFIAAAAGVREGFHIRIVVLVNSVRPSYRRAVDGFSNALVGLFGVLMIWFGIELAQATWQHVIPTLGISRGYAYIPIPISGALIAFFALEQLVAGLRGNEVKKLWS
jgi:TRAP-type C4-dicarboxylate transport system permease small subunit